MKLRFEIPDIGFVIEIDSGSSKLFDMMKLMEEILHHLRTKRWAETQPAPSPRDQELSRQKEAEKK